MAMLRLDPNDLAHAAALRRRLELLAEPALPVLNPEQVRRIRTMRRMHDCVAPAAVVHDKPEYRLQQIVAGLETTCETTRKRVNDAHAMREAAALRAARMNPDLDIQRDVHRVLSNTSMMMNDPSSPALARAAPREKWRPDASLLAAPGNAASGRVQFIPDQVMSQAEGDDELDSYLQQQRWLCKGCLNPIKKKSFPFRNSKYDARFCFYTGYYYCKDCHSNERRCRIPARCLVLWDFDLYPVCDKAADYLEIINDKPLFCVSAHQPRLYDQLPLLATCRQVRLQLSMMYEIGKLCSRFNATFFTPPAATMHSSLHHDDTPNPSSAVFVPGDRRYLIEDSECWSLSDLAVLKQSVPVLPEVDPRSQATATAGSPSPARARQGLRLTDVEHACPMLQFLRRVRSQMVRHIAQACPTLCHRAAAKSCNACTVDEVLYSFDVDNVVTCPRCDAAFHRHCWETKVTEGCPNCAAQAVRAARGLV
jgi:hypothetical protein